MCRRFSFFQGMLNEEGEKADLILQILVPREFWKSACQLVSYYLARDCSTKGDGTEIVPLVMLLMW